MVCPSCGSQIAGQGKFCATCGAKLPEAAPAPAPVAPPAWSQAAPPPPPAQPPAAPFGDPRYPAAGQFPAQYSAPQYPAPQYGAPQYGAPQWGAPAAARPAMAGVMPIGGVLALAGGAVAIVAAWLPWMTGAGESLNAMDATNMAILECGYYLLIGGGIAGDFPICVVPMLHQDLHRTGVPLWGYFCQISDSTTSYGSYSGAVPNEKITWGKLAADTPRFIIESDATIVAPLVFAWVLGQ